MSDIRRLTRDDPEFYPVMGPFLASRDVVRHVGGSIWDDPGKAWHVAVDGRDVAGFIATRTARGLVVAESCYAVDGAVMSDLIAAAIGAAAPSPLVTTVLRENSGVYLAAGFAQAGETTRFLKLLWSPR